MGSVGQAPIPAPRRARPPGQPVAKARRWRFRRPGQILRSRAGALLLVMVLAAAMAVAASSRSQAGSPPEPAVVVVQPHDTLWSVAARHLPSRDPYGMIEEIRRLNGLTGHTIHPGQQLLVPQP